MLKWELLVLRDLEQQKRIIESVHMGSGDSDTARCLGGHIGIDRTRAKILERFYWKYIGQDVKNFVLACDRCQKVNPVQHAEVAELHPVPVPTAVMAQIGIDITNLPRKGGRFTEPANWPIYCG